MAAEIHDMYAPTEFGASPGRVSAVRNGSKRVKAADNAAAEALEPHRLTRRQTTCLAEVAVARPNVAEPCSCDSMP